MRELWVGQHAVAHGGDTLSGSLWQAKVLKTWVDFLTDLAARVQGQKQVALNAKVMLEAKRRGQRFGK